MQSKLFLHDDVEELDFMLYQFYNVKLKIGLGGVKAGDKFDKAKIDYDKGILQLWRDDAVIEYRLHLTVGLPL